MALLLSEHEAEFQELIRMSQTDLDVVSITPTSLGTRQKLLLLGEGDEKSIEQIIPAGRWSTYQELFRKAHISGGLFKGPNGAINFEIDRPSFRNGDSRKGIAYHPNAPRPLVRSLDGLGYDEVSKLSPSTRMVYRQVTKGWYLYLFFNF